VAWDCATTRKSKRNPALCAAWKVERYSGFVVIARPASQLAPTDCHGRREGGNPSSIYFRRHPFFSDGRFQTNIFEVCGARYCKMLCIKPFGILIFCRSSPINAPSKFLFFHNVSCVNPRNNFARLQRQDFPDSLPCRKPMPVDAHAATANFHAVIDFFSLGLDIV
jgi:hypothetical protein